MNRGAGAETAAAPAGPKLSGTDVERLRISLGELEIARAEAHKAERLARARGGPKLTKAQEQRKDELAQVVERLGARLALAEAEEVMARVGASSARLEAAGSAEVDADALRGDPYTPPYTPSRHVEEEADGDELAT